MAEFRRKTAYTLLWLYKRSFSVIFQAFGIQCRHAPTCSEYGAECVSRFGLWPGFWMTLARFLRCRPGGSHGHDPVPDVLGNHPFWTPWRYGIWTLPHRSVPDSLVDPEHKDEQE